MANQNLGTEHEFEWVRKLLEGQQDTDAASLDLHRASQSRLGPLADLEVMTSTMSPLDSL